MSRMNSTEYAARANVNTGAPFPSAVACLGPREVIERFIDEFSALGDIWERLPIWDE